MGILAVSLLSIPVFVFWAWDLTINTTASMPIGIWKVKPISKSESIARGSAVLFCPPDSEIFRKAKADGILQAGSCKGSYMPLLKEVVGLPGDVVEYRGAYSVNELVLPNSKILAIGSAGYQQPINRRFIVPEGKVLLLGLSSPLSFDGRYFGLLDREKLEGFASIVVSLK